jgi:hypothetical protein
MKLDRKIWKIEYKYVHLKFSLKMNTNKDTHIGVFTGYDSDILTSESILT